MAFIPSNRVAQVEVRGLLQGERVENVLYFAQPAAAITGAALEVLADGIETWWEAWAGPIISSNYQFREVYAVDQTSVTGPTATSSVNAGWSGQRIAGGAAPNSATLTISFRTEQRGRSFRGRNFWPGLCRDDIVTNQVNQTVAGDIVQCYEQLLPFGGSTPAGWTWVVLSRRTNNAPRLEGVYTDITAVLLVDRFIDSQRRRLPGRGN